MNLERRIDIAPAYDKVSEGYGIHGVEMRWYVKGPEGVVQFLLYTNWHLPHVQDRLDARMDSQFPHLSCHPQPADIGYHSYKPRYEGQTAVQKDCHLLNGPCYYDGSSLQAKDFYKILVEKGGDALWEALEKRYQEWLVEVAP